MSTPQTLSRNQVEHLVRQAVYREMGLSLPGQELAPNPLVVNISARHCHLTQEAVEILFGTGHHLTPMKWLYQDGYFAAKESVTLVGPRSRVISNLRILGPCRSACQVELASTDAVALGFDIPVRISGDIAGTPGCMLMGPNGFFQMDEGVIRAAPHVHMSPADCSYYGVKDKELMKLKVGGPLGMTFERIQVRESKDVKLEVHLDTDEGNACGLHPNTPVELTRS